MKFKIQAGSTIDAATPEEVRDTVNSSQQNWFQEMARGVKHLRFEAQANVAGGSLVIDAASLNLGPQAGFIWAIQRVTMEGLAAADTVYVYRSPAPVSGGPSGRLYGQITGANSLHIGSKGIVLHGGERLAVFGSGFSDPAGTTGIVNGEAIEVPEFMAWKLL